MRRAAFTIARVAVSVALLAFIVSRLRADLHDRTITGELAESPLATIVDDSLARHEVLRSNLETLSGDEGRVIGRIPGLFWGLFPDKVVAGRLAPSDTVLLRDRSDGQTYAFDRDALTRAGDLWQGVYPGTLTCLRRSSLGILAVSFALVIVINVALGMRWWVLLRIQGVDLSPWDTIRYSYIGLFFNSILPGLTGGDLVKAYYVVKRTHRKTHAFATVVLDRLSGLFAMGILTVIAMSLSLDQAVLRQYPIPEAVYLFMALALVGGSVFYSRRLRSVFRVEAIIARLPLSRVLREFDEALFLYRYHHKAALAVLVASLLIQLLSFFIQFLYGRSLGITQLGYEHYLLFLPIIYFVSSLPISLSGLGVREASFAFLFGLIGVPASLAVMLSLIFFFLQTLSSLPGGVFYALMRQKITRDEIAQTLQPDESPAPPGASPCP
ncbi:MAG: lysylphosphatidylglycerol synthase transmembrane domain-containing protein [Planctomycetota bacterium]